MAKNQKKGELEGRYMIILRPGLSHHQVQIHLRALTRYFTWSPEKNHIYYTFQLGVYWGYSARLSVAMVLRQRRHPDVLHIHATPFLSTAALLLHKESSVAPHILKTKLRSMPIENLISPISTNDDQKE